MTRVWRLAPLCLAALVASAGTEGADRPNPLAGLPWSPGRVRGEPILFLQDRSGGLPQGALLFPPTRVVSVSSGDGTMEFVAGRDYLVAPESRVLRLPDGSRIPFRTQAALYPPRGSPQSIAEAAGGRSNLFWSEGHVFHDLQVRVEYEHESRWSGTRPREADKELSRSIARLRRREAFRLVVLGDSISEGYNASGFVRAAPHQPPYAELVAERLRTHGNQSVILHNLSVAGKSTPWGLEQIPAVVREAPDLVVLAFGMNDASGRRSPTEFAANIRKMIEQARAGLPECEFILVASMVGNPEWSHSAPDLYPRYREELRKLQGPGVAVADLTTLWLDLLERKRFTDLTGNGVNHPNDYGHRLYAGMILGLLGRD